MGNFVSEYVINTKFVWIVIFAIIFLVIIFRLKQQLKDKPEKQVRRRRMPYAANGLLDEAKMAGTEARAVLGKAIKKNGGMTHEDLHVIEHELNTVILKIIEVQQIQINEK